MTNQPSLLYLDYPVYGIACNSQYILTAGGGGGSNYGIEDCLEIHLYCPKKNSIEKICVSTEFGGVLDSIVHSFRANIWAGIVKDKIIFFDIDATYGPKILNQFQVTLDNDGRRRRNHYLQVVRFAPSGEALVAGGTDHKLRVWSIPLVHTEKPGISDSAEGASSFDREGGKKHSLGFESKGMPSLRYDEAKDIQLLHEFTGHSGEIKDCSINRESLLVASCATDFKCLIWNLKTGALIQRLVPKISKRGSDEDLMIRCCKFFAPGKSASSVIPERLLAVGHSSKGSCYAVIWDISVEAREGGLKQAKVIYLGPSPCSALSISHDGAMFAIGFSSGICRVYNQRFSVLLTHKLHHLPVTGVCFLPGHPVLLSSGADFSVVISRPVKTKERGFMNATIRVFFILLLLFGILLVLQDFFLTGKYVEVSHLRLKDDLNQQVVESFYKGAKNFDSSSLKKFESIEPPNFPDTDGTLWEL